MSYIQYVRPREGAGTFLAVAAYDGLAAPFVLSLFSSALNVDRSLGLCIFAGNCHVDDSRNRLVRDFLESGCEQLVFLDADVCWVDADLRKLIDHDADIVAGIYPMKNDDEVEYPVKPLPGERWARADGLVEVEGVPTGFLKIRRRVLETLAETVPTHFGRGESPGDRRRIPIIFERTLNGDSRRGGDYEFCRKARAAGFQVYVDPMMQLAHQGVKVWHGCLGHFWRKDIAVPEGLRAIREGRDTAETYLEMYNAWGNNWALAPEALFAAVQMARAAAGTIIDCGSGLSTLCLAAARPDVPVVAFESSAVWGAKVESLAKQAGLNNVFVLVREVMAYDGFDWYATTPQDGNMFTEAGLVICDGPPRKTGRMGLFNLFGEVVNCPVLVDDVAHGEYRRELEVAAARMGRTLHTFDSMKQQFGVMV